MNREKHEGATDRCKVLRKQLVLVSIPIQSKVHQQALYSAISVSAYITSV